MVQLRISLRVRDYPRSWRVTGDGAQGREGASLDAIRRKGFHFEKNHKMTSCHIQMCGCQNPRINGKIRTAREQGEPLW